MQHSFDVDIAKEYGILEAILLNNIWFWIEKNKANNTNFYDGYYWTYNSTRAFNELFPYVSQRQIQNALKKLIDNGILKTGNYNKVAYDRTLWYAFTEKGKCIMQKCKMEDVEKGNGLGNNDEPIPDRKPSKKPSKKPNNKTEFIPPTLEEVKEYCLSRKNKIDPQYFYDYFTASDWVDSKGNKVKNWKQKIITWEGFDNNNKTSKQSTRKEVIPEWMNKEHKAEPLSPEAQRKMEELIKEFKEVK